MQRKISEKVKIERFNNDGSGFTKLNNKTLHIWNALPEEEVIFEIIKKNRFHIEGIAIEIFNKSSERIEPEENHFTSCSPWQILSPEAEGRYKKEFANRVFANNSKLPELLNEHEVYTNDKLQHYRYKMEYHVYTDEKNNFFLGIFGRTEKKKIPIEPCVLADNHLNSNAQKIIAWLDKIKFPRPLLKTLIIRSNRKGQTIAGLFVKTEEIEELLNSPFDNLTIYYSNPKSPASVATKILMKAKTNTLEETLLDNKFTFGLMSFFQINPEVFEETLKNIKNFVPENSSIIDFYSGVGTIGISMKDKASKIIMVEENSDAVEFAKINITKNNLKNAEVFLGQAHELLEHIDDNSILIVDPPRGGLHPKVIKKIKNTLPPRIIYLSCNIESQNRDLKELQENYSPIFAKTYNFFPRTPHLESLIILDKK